MTSQDGEQTFSHYFKSKCHPACPDITVTAIKDKTAFHLLKVQDNLGLESLADVRTLTVKEVAFF